MKTDIYRAKAPVGVRYEKSERISAPRIIKVRAIRNTLFVDLDFKNTTDGTTSILVLDKMRKGQDRFISTYAIGTSPGLQVDLSGKKMQLSFSYITPSNVMGLESETVVLEKQNGQWQVSLL